MIYSLLIGCFMKQTPVPDSNISKALPIPEIATPRVFTPPEASSVDSQLWVLENNSLPVIVIQLTIPGGSGSDPEGQWGRAAMVSEMLTESVGDYDALGFSDLLYQNAIDVSVSTGVYNTLIRFSFHKDQLDTILPLMSAMLFKPQFTEKDWERVRTNQINSIQQDREDSPTIAAQYDGYFLYGSEHPIGIPTNGTPKTIDALNREEAAKWHQSRLDADETYFSVVGAISQVEAKTKLEKHFQDWTVQDKIEESGLSADIQSTKGILLIDMPGAEQTTIRVFSKAFEKYAPEQYAADLAGLIMGGSFTSRLNSILREEKGYTYGVGARFIEEKHNNYFIVSTSVQTAVTVEALQELFLILDSAKEGYSAEEIQKAKAGARSSIIEISAGRKQLATHNIFAMLNGEDPDFLQVDLDKNAAVSSEEMTATAKYFDPKNGIVILVGDVSQYEAKLTEAGLDYKIVTLPE